MIAAIAACLAIAVAALCLDWRQTLQIARNPATLSEINVILGKHPSVSRVCWYFGACVLLVVLLTGLLWWYALPGLAVGLCVLVGVFEAAVVWRNFRLGISA
ncbi:hypothetical protein BX589_12079 [Paraburkholderia fungorum]|jgi:hypothetical protein|uniref:hypothetical protein n=1 Tax=Paraburkholderia fungorum TaxID=134537 RepID=UPI000D079D18|nr:hypothetical protein [Paraburkholderia fungorum]PRZ51238.1 hypothetical protein BX589_12079 [Paraburkholderia fungorum]